MPYTCRVFNSVAEIDLAAWKQVCAQSDAPIFMDARFAAAIEAGMQPDCRFWFVIVYDEAARPVACAGLCAMKIDFTDFGDPRVTWMVKRGPSFLSRFRHMSILFCSLPGSPGDRSIAIATPAASAQILALLDGVMVKIATEAGAEAVIFKEFAPADLETMNPLLELGYRRVEVPPMHLLDPAFENFAQYCAALRTRYRQQVNRSARKLTNSGIEPVVLTDADEILRRYTPDVHAMYCEMVAKSDVKVEVLPIDYYRQLTRHMAGHVELITLMKEGRIVAFGWCLYDSTTYHMMYAGLDYRLNHEFDLYFNLMHAGFDRALSKRLTRIHVGQTATVFKARMGCVSEARFIYTKGLGPLMSRLFHYGSRFLVIKKPSNPPADIFKRDGLARQKVDA